MGEMKIERSLLFGQPVRNLIAVFQFSFGWWWAMKRNTTSTSAPHVEITDLKIAVIKELWGCPHFP